MGRCFIGTRTTIRRVVWGGSSSIIHYNPRAVSELPLRRNVDGTATPALIGAAAAFVPDGPLVAFLLSMLNGIIYTQHVHGYSHLNKDDVPKVIRATQSIPLYPVFLSPEEHTRHHGRGRSARMLIQCSTGGCITSRTRRSSSA